MCWLQIVILGALSGAAGRFSARGDGIRYLRSIFLARQERLLSLFAADGPGTVRAVSQASLVPFASIEPAVELPGPDLPWLPSRRDRPGVRSLIWHSRAATWGGLTCRPS